MAFNLSGFASAVSGVGKTISKLKPLANLGVQAYSAYKANKDKRANESFIRDLAEQGTGREAVRAGIADYVLKGGDAARLPGYKPQFEQLKTDFEQAFMVEKMNAQKEMYNIRDNIKGGVAKERMLRNIHLRVANARHGLLKQLNSRRGDLLNKIRQENFVWSRGYDNRIPRSTLFSAAQKAYAEQKQSLGVLGNLAGRQFGETKEEREPTIRYVQTVPPKAVPQPVLSSNILKNKPFTYDPEIDEPLKNMIQLEG